MISMNRRPPAAAGAKGEPQVSPWGPAGSPEHPTGVGIVNLRTREMRIVGQVPVGDLGSSIRLHDTVAHLIAARYPYTMALTLTALGLGLCRPELVSAIGPVDS